MPSWLTTLLSVIAGGALTIASGWLADVRQTARDRERRREETRERFLVRRNDFQRENLLELQSFLQKLVRTTGAMHHINQMAYRQAGKWQRQLYT
jgi:hypothetical protein